MKPSKLFGRSGLFLLLAVLVAACARPSPVTPTLPPPVATTPARTNTPKAVPTLAPTPAPVAADEIIIGLLQDREPDTLWPLGTPTEEQRLVQAAIMEPAMTKLGYDYQAVLFTSVPTLENKGARLESIRVSLDPATGAITTSDTGVYTNVEQLQVTFVLRPDLYWSDGEPVKAVDSVFGYNVACASGADNARLYRCDKVERYEAADDKTIRVTFKPGVFDLDYFTYYWDFMPEHAWSGYTPEEMATTDQIARFYTPCYGPYMVQDWTPGESITLVKNPHYVFHGRDYPAVSKIIFKFLPNSYELLAQLVNGQIDLIDPTGTQSLDPELLRTFEENGLLRLYPQPSLHWENIVMNFNDPQDLTKPHPVLSDLKVRQAIAYGSDRSMMALQLYTSEVPILNTWIPAAHWAYPGDDALAIYSYDGEKAAGLLEEAGWILADDGFRYKDGARLQLDLYIMAGQPLREQIAQLFKSQMAALGMEIEIVRVREEEWYGEESPLTRRAFDLVEFAWIGSMEPDGQVMYNCEEVPSEGNFWSGQNYGGWCNETATAALLDAAKEIERDKRIQDYRIAQQQFTQDVPALPLFGRLDLYAAHPALSNLHLDPTEVMTWNVWEWSMPAKKP